MTVKERLRKYAKDNKISITSLLRKRGKIQKDINHKESKMCLSLSEVKELK